eukprot:jgi/Psemu1/38007/gm1.38007_g
MPNASDCTFTSSCGTARPWEDHKETTVSELPGCMDYEGGTMELQQIHSCGTARPWEDHKKTTVSELPGCMDDEGGTMELQQIHFGDHQEALQEFTGGGEDEGKDKSMTELLSSVKNSMKGNSHTQNGMEGNSHTQAGINEDEKDSGVSDDRSIDVKNPYPTSQDHHIRLKTHHNSAEDKDNKGMTELLSSVKNNMEGNYHTQACMERNSHTQASINEDEEENDAIDRLIARVNWNALQLKIRSHCMHIQHHQTNIENLQTMRRAILHLVKMLAETLESLPFPKLLEGQSLEELNTTGLYIQDRLVQIGTGLTIAGWYTVLMASNHRGSDEKKVAQYHLQKLMNRNEVAVGL